MKLWKSIKAISSIIAVIILIAITIAGGLLVFVIMTNTLTGNNQRVQVNFEYLSLYRSIGEPGVVFAATLKNVGSGPIKLLTVKVDNEFDYVVPSVTASTPLEPGRTVGVSLTPPDIHAEWYVVGNDYSATVGAEAVDGSTFSTVTTVKCLGVGGPGVGQYTATFYSTASDGYITSFDENVTVTKNVSYVNAWFGNGSYLSLDDTGSQFALGQWFFESIPENHMQYTIYRAFVFFNVSLPDGAIKTGATLSLYQADDNSDTDFNITIQNGQPLYPHYPLEEGDFAQENYFGNGGQLDTTGFEGYIYNITFNSEGLTWINTTGTTKLCLRSDRDIGGIEPTENEFIDIYSSAVEEGYKPKLVITYTLPVTPPIEEKFEYNNNYFYSDAPTGDEWYGQTFTPQIRHKLSKIVFYGQRIGEPTGNFIVSVRATDVDGLPTGEDLVVKSVLASSISPELGEIEIVFDTQITLEVDTQYAIVLRNPGGDSDNNILLYYCDDVYPRGIFVESADCGETWIISSPSLDFWFEEWGY